MTEIEKKAEELKKEIESFYALVKSECGDNVDVLIDVSDRSELHRTEGGMIQSVYRSNPKPKSSITVTSKKVMYF